MVKSAPTSPDPREADVDPVSVSRAFVHQSQAAKLGHLPAVQELLQGAQDVTQTATSCMKEPEHRVLTEPYLHAIEGQVAGDLKLLREHLLLDVVDADEFGLSSCQDRLPVRRVAQRCEGPEKASTQAEFLSARQTFGPKDDRRHSLSLSRLLGCDFICLFAARLQVVASDHGAGLCGRVGVPERDLPVQSGHSQLLTVGTVRHRQG